MVTISHHILLLALLLSVCFSLSAEADLRSAYQNFFDSPMPAASQDTVNEMRKYHMVLVPGFTGDLVSPLYFTDARALMDHQQVSYDMIPRSSFRHVMDDDAKLLAIMHDLYEKGGRKPLVLLGHSMGGNRIVNLLIHHPELLEKGIVAKVVAFQSPLRSSPLIQGLNDANNTLLARAYDRFVPNFVRRLSPLRGINSLTETESKKYMAEEFSKLPPKQQQLVSDSVLYMTSESSPENAGKLMRPMIEKMQKLGLRNDALVPTSNMYLTYGDDEKLIGTSLGHIESDHMQTSVSNYGLNYLVGEGPTNKNATALFLAFETNFVAYQNDPEERAKAKASTKEHFRELQKERACSVLYGGLRKY